MPFAPKIRKEILAALDEHILPAFEGERLTQFLAEMPFDFSGTRHWEVRKEPLDDLEFGEVLTARHWFAQQMLAINTVTIGFVFRGERIERVGATQVMAAQARKAEMPVPAGITAIHIPAPGFICYGSGIPHGDGTPWPPQVAGEVLGLTVVAGELRVFLSKIGSDASGTSHSLQIAEPHLLHLLRLFHEELRLPGAQKSAHALLFAALCRLRRGLGRQRPHISNSSWPSLETALLDEDGVEERHREICQEVAQYIQTHLHTPLSVAGLSRQFRLSSSHLSHIFKRTYGSSVMHYVALQRIRAAQGILIDGNERVSDIAQLLGFSGSVSFCRSFKRVTGTTPSEFRYKYRDGVE